MSEIHAKTFAKFTLPKILENAVLRQVFSTRKNMKILRKICDLYVFSVIYTIGSLYLYVYCRYLFLIYGFWHKIRRTIFRLCGSVSPYFILPMRDKLYMRKIFVCVKYLIRKIFVKYNIRFVICTAFVFFAL